MITNFLVTGPPGVGKTTIVRDVVRRLGLRAGGFYTEEIREGCVRMGFKIVRLDGQEGILAHVNRAGRPRAGKYGVNMADLESVAVGSLRDALMDSQIIVVDEIGKMELLSSAFREMTIRCLDSEQPVLGTIIWRPHPHADAIKSRSDVEIIEVREGNRDELREEIVRRLMANVSSKKRA